MVINNINHTGQIIFFTLPYARYLNLLLGKLQLSLLRNAVLKFYLQQQSLKALTGTKFARVLLL